MRLRCAVCMSYGGNGGEGSAGAAAAAVAGVVGVAAVGALLRAHTHTPPLFSKEIEEEYLPTLKLVHISD